MAVKSGLVRSFREAVNKLRTAGLYVNEKTVKMVAESLARPFGNC